MVYAAGKGLIVDSALLAVHSDSVTAQSCITRLSTRECVDESRGYSVLNSKINMR